VLDAIHRDRAVYDPTLIAATASSCSANPLAIQCIGPSFFASYRTFPDTFYSHGFNLAWNNASGYSTLQETVPLACKAIGSQLNVYELGNEPDLFIGKWRPSNWTEEDYAAEWLNGTAHIAAYLQEACPEQADGGVPYMYPSASSAGSKFPGPRALQDVLIQTAPSGDERRIPQLSQHNYITGATSPGVTLQHTLLNHTTTVASLKSHVTAAQNISKFFPSTAYILGECNSLYGGGANGLSDVFGAALWTLDFTLHAASTGWIKRLHYHQSNGAAYSAWTPNAAGGRVQSTHPPYYGKLAAAKFLGPSNASVVSELPLSGNGLESAYAAYEDGNLVRLAVLSIVEFNATTPAGTRPVEMYGFALGSGLGGSVWLVERLTAPGSNVTTGLTFGGYAYEYATLGKPSKVNCTACNETVKADSDGLLSIGVSHSEAAILSLV
jgi:hypothetical protein